MKTFTKYLAGFAVTALILTIAVRVLLSFLVETKQSALCYIVAGIYAVSVFVSGWIFGDKERRYLPIHDIGFRYNLTTYLIFNGVWELWFVLGFNSHYENNDMAHFSAILWGSIVLVHYIMYRHFRKKLIDGLDKKDLFE